MKQFLFASALVLAATAATAGSYGDPVVTPDVVMTETVKTASPDDGVTILMFLLVAAAALAS